MTDSTGQSLTEHWAWAAPRGLLNKHTAESFRVACDRVLSVLDEWQTADVRQLDVEDLLRRFQHLRKKEYAPKSLSAYQRRFRQAHRMYLEYLESPDSWPRSAKRATPDSERPRETRMARVRTTGGAHTSEPETSPTSRLPHAQDLVEYPYPLRQDATVRMALPRDITRAEVGRLHAFMLTLAVDFEP